MSRDSGAEHPSQRTVAELLAEHGGGSQRSARRRRRRAEDPTETAPQAIINRVNSDSGRMRPVPADDETAQPPSRQSGPVAGSAAAPAPDATPQAPPAAPAPAAPSHGDQEATESPKPPSGPGFWARRFTGGGAGVNGGDGGTGTAGVNGTNGTAGVTGTNGTAGVNGTNGTAAPVSRPEQTGGPPPPDSTSEPAVADTEVTAQQPVVPRHPEPPRSTPAPSPAAQAPQAVPNPEATGQVRYRDDAVFSPSRPGTEGATEQFPPVHGTVASETAETNGTRTPDAEATGVAMPVYPPGGDGHAPAPGYQDPYDSLDYDEDYETDYAGAYGADDYAGTYGPDDFAGGDGYGDGYDDGDEDFGDGYDPDLPAGMDAEDYLGEDADDEVDESERAPAKEWLVLTTQVGAGLLGGGALWIGFRWLWTTVPVAALAAALAVTGALVLIARKFLRTDDLQTILLAVLVGLVCTVSPAALLLVGY